MADERVDEAGHAGLAVVVAAATVFVTVPRLACWRRLAQRLGEVALFTGLAMSSA